jgi:hypothetical protein
MERHSVRFVNLLLAVGEELQVVSLKILSQSTKNNMVLVLNKMLVMKEVVMERNRQNFLLVFLMQHSQRKLTKLLFLAETKKFSAMQSPFWGRIS